VNNDDDDDDDDDERAGNTCLSRAIISSVKIKNSYESKMTNWLVSKMLL
jgi:hypothetical protein